MIYPSTVQMMCAVLFNPLTLKLNPSEQGNLPEFFTGDFKFLLLTLRKKAYIIYFSFKFN